LLIYALCIHINNLDLCGAGNYVREIPTSLDNAIKTIIPLTVTFQLVCWLLTSEEFGRCCDWWISSLGYMSGWRRINRFHMDQRTHTSANRLYEPSGTTTKTTLTL